MVPLARFPRALLALALLQTPACKSSTPIADVTPTPTSTATPTTPTTPAAPAATTRPDMPSADAVTTAARGSNAFALDLYARLRATPGNLALSPASISSALAMTWGGAKGDTAAQMQKTLHFTGDQATVVTGWGSLTRALSEPSRPLKLAIANRLFGEKTYKFEQPFLDRTKAAFDAPLEALDFKGAYEPSRVHINAWVEEQTQKRIKDLLPARSLNADTRMVLVNAIYFLADWAQPFEQTGTYMQAFNVSKDKRDKKVMMMHGAKTLRIAQAAGVQVLEMPYKGNDASMLVFLPTELDGLDALEKSLSTEKLDAWTAALAPQLVDVSLPRFEVNPAGSLALADHLKALGMPLAFDSEKADFTGIGNPPDPRERLHIDQVFHKAFVKVDEKGTEAAAATAISMATGAGAPPKMVQFTADHPFLFAIVDRASKLILFLGRVAEP
jgi:serpin B